MSFKPYAGDPPPPPPSSGRGGGRGRQDTTPAPSGRRHGMRPPPDFYTPPILTDTTPNPAVTARTAQRRDQVITGAQGYVPFAYGRVRLPGQILYFYSNGVDFWYVLGFCKGEVDSLVKCWWNNVDVVATYPSRINIYFHTGTAGQTVDTNFSAVDTSWNESLPNICYAIVQLVNITGNWPELPNLMFEIKGRKVLDPRNSTTAYSENGVLQFYDWQRDKEGRNRGPERINTAAINAAATIADQILTVTVARYAFHIVTADGAICDDIEKTFLILLDAMLPYTQNQFYLIIDRPGSSIASYDDSAFLLDPPPEGYREEPAEHINDVALEWTDTTNNWVPRTERLSTPAVVAGLDDARTATYKLPWIHDLAIVQTKLTYLLNAYIFDFKLKLSRRSSTADLMVGDLITQSVAARGIAAQQWRIISREKIAATNTYNDLLLEYNAAKYADSVGSATAKIASSIPDIGSIPPDVSGFTGSSITEELYQEKVGYWQSRARLTWTNPTYLWLDVVELYVSINGGEYRFIDEYAGAAGAVMIAHFNEITAINVPYSFKLVVRSNPASGRNRSPGVIVSKTFVGKTTPPADVPSLIAGSNGDRVLLIWQPSPDQDVIRYEIRRGTSANSWSTAVYVAQTDLLHYTDTPPYGNWRFFVKPIDSAQNYSTNPATVDVNMAPIGNPTPTEFTAYGSWQFTGGFTPTVACAAGGGALFNGSGNLIIEEIFSYASGLSDTILLSRLTSPQAAENERAAMTAPKTVGDWATQIDNPRRSGAPIWAPLPANAFGEIYGTTQFPINQRLTETRIRLLSVQHQGNDTPTNVALAQPFVRDMDAGVSYYGPSSLTPPAPPVAQRQCGVRLSSNSPTYQQVVKSWPNGQEIWGYFVDRKTFRVAQDVTTTDASGLATISYSYPAYPSAPAAVFNIQAITGSSSGVVVIVDHVDPVAKTVRFKSYNITTGAAAPTVTFNYMIDDSGRSASSSFWMP